MRSYDETVSSRSFLRVHPDDTLQYLASAYMYDELILDTTIFMQF